MFLNNNATTAQNPGMDLSPHVAFQCVHCDRLFVHNQRDQQFVEYVGGPTEVTKMETALAAAKAAYEKAKEKLKGLQKPLPGIKEHAQKMLDKAAEAVKKAENDLAAAKAKVKAK